MRYLLASSSFRRGVLTWAAVIGVGLLTAAAALAQSGGAPAPGEKRARPQPETPPRHPLPKPEAAPGAPDAAKAKPAVRAPQTADEKAKLLADLYAQLATAEDKGSAKKHAGAIERLWAYSGSDTVNLLLERSAGAAREKRTDLALKLLDAAVSLAPDYPEAFNQRAYFHFNQNNYDGAVGDLRRVLALDPNHFKALEGLAQIFKETGNKKAAYQILKQLIDVHPFASGAKTAYEELKREVEGQGI